MQRDREVEPERESPSGSTSPGADPGQDDDLKTSSNGDTEERQQ